MYGRSPPSVRYAAERRQSVAAALSRSAMLVKQGGSPESCSNRCRASGSSLRGSAKRAAGSWYGFSPWARRTRSAPGTRSNGEGPARSRRAA